MYSMYSIFSFLPPLLTANIKHVEPNNGLAKVFLSDNHGWLFEHHETGEVLDRLGEELVVVQLTAAQYMETNRKMEDKYVNIVTVHTAFHVLLVLLVLWCYWCYWCYGVMGVIGVLSLSPCFLHCADIS